MMRWGIGFPLARLPRRPVSGRGAPLPGAARWIRSPLGAALPCFAGIRAITTPYNKIGQTIPVGNPTLEWFPGGGGAWAAMNWTVLNWAAVNFRADRRISAAREFPALARGGGPGIHPDVLRGRVPPPAGLPAGRQSPPMPLPPIVPRLPPGALPPCAFCAG